MTKSVKLLFEKPNKNASPINVCMGYPNMKKYGLSALGFLTTYKFLELNPDTNVEMAFSDSKKPKKTKPDIFGFSMSFETDFKGVFKILETNNIPLRKELRDDSHPLIFGGGPVMTGNPEPFADFFDFINIGDGEDVFNKIIETYKEFKKEPKEEILIQLSKIKGVYVPALYDVEYDNTGQIVKYTQKHNDAKFLGRNIATNSERCVSSPLLSDKAYMKNTLQVEVSRGCPLKCKYCNASYLNAPVRYPSKEIILKTIEEGLNKSDSLNLVGASIAHHPDFEEICEAILKLRKTKNFRIGVSTLRAEKVTSVQAKMLSECSQKSVSLSIEGISQRIRDMSGRMVTEEEMFKSLQALNSNDVKNITMYMLIGVVDENTDDMDELILFLEKLKDKFPEMKFSFIFSTFTPKAQTPYQLALMHRPQSISKKADLIKSKCKQLGHKVVFSSSRWDYLSALLSRGDRRLGAVIEKVYKTNASFNDWKKIQENLLKEGYEIPNLDWYVYRKRNKNEKLPWDVISAK